MKNSNKTSLLRLAALALALILVVSAVAFTPSRAADTSSLGQLVDSFTANSSSFTLSGSSRLYIVATAAPAANLVEAVQVAQQQFAAESLPSATVMPIVWGDTSKSATGDILIQLDANCGLAADGYKLVVDGTASVTASNVRGILYGLNALQKHFRMASGLQIQGFTTTDVPDTAERTVSLDFARKYYSKDWICNFIRQMSWMGYNTLQLHLAEDSGIRMDIWDPAYYKGRFQPANDFSWICGSENAYYLYIFSPDGVVQTDQHKDWYLSTAEVIEILETARRYQIDVIPSFDSPGHMDYLNWKYEDHYLSNTGYTFYSTYYNKTYAAADIEGVINYTNAKSANITPIRNKPYFKAVNINNEQAKAFVMELYTDLANFFKEYAGSTDFSICADEVVLTGTLNTGYSFQFGYGDFVSYINELNTHLNGLGYTCRAYNDFLGHTTYASSYPLSSFASNLEIMYWSSSYNSGTGGTTTCKDVYYFDGDRTIYNCLSNHTYYAMAYHYQNSHPDCRCPDNYSWTMGYGTEEIVYNNWAPNDYTARGKYNSSTMKVEDQYAVGAYFLIWSDNPTLSTESEIWNGFYSCDNDHLYVSLFDRMWSNIIKMWNWDIDSSLTFANFTALRDEIKFFPGLGYNSTTGLYLCSSAPTYAAATEPVCLSEREALKAELAGGKLDSAIYTDSSYATYSAAFDAAATALDSGTDVEISNTLAALLEAKENLVVKNFRITVTYKNKDTDNTVGDPFTEKTAEGSNEFEIYLPRLSGYEYVSAEGAAFSLSPSGDGSGFLRGTITADISVTVWLTAAKDDSRLQNLIEEAIPSQSVTDTVGYTAESWAAYTAALAQAKALTDTATQVEVSSVITLLEQARTNLVISIPAAEAETHAVTLAVELLNESTPVGKQVAFYVTSAANVTGLTVKKGADTIAPLLTTAEVQELDSGAVVKQWLILLPAEETADYTITDGTTEKTVSVTVS